MDRYCGTQVREERILVEELKRRGLFEKLSLSERIMQESILKFRVGGCGVNSCVCEWERGLNL